MKKILERPISNINEIPDGKFQIYNLFENPFPSMPIINKESEEKKYNGSIYEKEIRQAEYNKLLTNFIQIPQSDLDHLRLGFLMDTSFIGRGNGKSAFMINYLKEINEEFCLNLSDNQNKCFGVYFAPETGGNSKTFRKFIDIFFNSILKLNIINYSLAVLRLEAIIQITGDRSILDLFESDNDIVIKLNDAKWFNSEIINKLKLNKNDITYQVYKNNYLQKLSPDFPLSIDKRLVPKISTQDDFADYYLNIKKDEDRYNFVFTELVLFFLAAGFNGSYVFVDDFERVPDFQSAIQRKDFVSQLRSVLFDGLYLNSKIGFYNFILALHAGVPRLIQEAWTVSGLEYRVSLNPTYLTSKHIILFEKFSDQNVVQLISKYIQEYRIDSTIVNKNGIYPFTSEALNLIGILSELNASKILQFAYHIIEYALENKLEIIDIDTVTLFSKTINVNLQPEKDINILNTPAIDLIEKSKNDEQ